MKHLIAQLEQRIARLEKKASGTDTREYKINIHYALTPDIDGDTFASKHLLEEKAYIMDKMIARYLGEQGEIKDFEHIYYRLPEFGGSYIVEARPNTFREDFEKTFKVKDSSVYVYFEVLENNKEIEIVAKIKRPRKVNVDVWEDFLDQGASSYEVEALLKKNKVTNLEEEEAVWDKTQINLSYKGTVKNDPVLISKLPKRRKLPNSGFIVTFKYSKI